MPVPGSAAAPTPVQVARYGHIASLLRERLKARDWNPGDLNEKLGKPRGYSGTYHWINGTGGPGQAYQRKLAKIFGVSAETFAPKALNGTDKAPVPAVLPGYTVTPKPPGVRTMGGDVMAFTVYQDGQARVKLDVVLPLAQAAPLFRVLLDAGLVLGGSTVPAEAG